jgi:hypothetical protein
MKGTVSPLGYIAVMLRKEAGGKPHRRLVHRLVAKAFLPPPSPEETDVAHNDGDPSNNRVENLRWATHRDNQMDMRKHGTMQDGSKSCTAKLTGEQAAEIRERVRNGPRGTQRQIARETGLSPAQINRIAKGHRWRHQILP